MMTNQTWCKLLREKFFEYGAKKVAMRHKQYGVWKSYTWKDYYDMVKYVTLGLVHTGLKPGDKVMLMGHNEPHLYWAAVGAIGAFGIATSFSPDATSSEIKYVMRQSNSRYAIVEDQEQVDKFLEIRSELPNLEKIIYWNLKGMSDYDDPILSHFSQLLTKGEEYETKYPGIFDQLLERSNENDLALLLYTSGSGVFPKGVLLSNKAGINSVHKIIAMASISNDFEIFSHMPLSWFSAYVLELGVQLVTGLTVNFPEGPETVLADLREIGPDFVVFTPRQWQSLISQIQIRIADASFLKRLCYRLFLPLGYAVFDKQGKINPLWKAMYGIGYLLLFRPLKNELGLLRVKSALTTGAPLSPESFRFLNALNLNLKQSYGLTEINPITSHQDGDMKCESVGTAVPGTEVKISEAGEVLVRGDHMFNGYYKTPKSTKTISKDGWIHTGDAGSIDKDGHLIYYGRVSDTIQLHDGERFAPTIIEGKLKFCSYIKDAIIITEDRLVIALIQIDFEALSKWAERNDISYATFADLSQTREAYELIGEQIDQVNGMLPEDAKVKKYFILQSELTPDESELTRSGKIRRDFIKEKYKILWEEEKKYGSS
jgi:long-chain acyl-CoA synthetase